MKILRFAALAAAAAALSASASASSNVENTKGSMKNAEIPVCGHVLGTIALVDGQDQGWNDYNLPEPSTLLKTFVTKSRCFKLVNRGAGMDVIQEEEFNIEGFAKKSDLSWGAGGFAGWAGVGGGSYSNTDVGKVVGLAFLDAYRQLVEQMGGFDANVVAAAPKKSFVTINAVDMKRSPSPSSSTVRKLQGGMMVYPLGGKEGMWWEVEDENGNVGWLLNDNLEPMK